MGLQRVQIDLLNQIAVLSRREKVQSFIVGGLLRDLLLKQDVRDVDLDFLVEGDVFQFANSIQHLVGGTLKPYPKFLTCKILNPEKLPGIQEIDFAQARKEIYLRPGSLPEVEPADLRQDLGRRDFSINALAVAVSEVLRVQDSDSELNTGALDKSVVDLHGGLDDLRAKQIRVLHERSFSDDPTRLFRACRYRVRLGAEIETSTRGLFQQALQADILQSISAFRIYNECLKTLDESNSCAVFDEFLRHGLYPGPEISKGHSEEKFLQSIARLDELFRPLAPGARTKKLKRKLGSCLLFLKSDRGKAAEYFKLRNISKKDREWTLRQVDGKPDESNQERLEQNLFQACLGNYDLELVRNALHETL